MKNPILEVIKRQPKQILLAALVRTSEQAPFYLFITFVITYATKHLKLSSNSILDDTLIAAALGLISVPLFGRLSDRFGRRGSTGPASSSRRCSPSRTSGCSTRATPCWWRWPS